MKCPRCRSGRTEDRLDGSQYCCRCGQRWNKINGEVVLTPSFDRRTLGEDMEQNMGVVEETVSVTEVVPTEVTVKGSVKKGRGRPMLPAGATVTRKNGTFRKGEDGKWHKV